MKRCPRCQRSFANTSRLCEDDGETLETANPEPGTQIGGRYRLIRILGEGGMGVVYLAEHSALGREVALKFLRGQFAEDPVILRRFQREARAASSIRHPGIVDVTDFGDDAEHGVFYTMEFVPGSTSLEEVVQRGPMDLDEVIRVGVGVADALAAAHEAGVIHRDLKPDNILLARRREGPPIPKILDFGIAGVVDDAENLTQTGSVFGTPPYMSPEQCMGRRVDERSDVYAFGIILYRLVTGVLPFRADNMLTLFEMHRSRPPAKPSTLVPQLPEALEEVILRCLAKRPEARFQTMNAVSAALSGREVPLETPAPVDDFVTDETMAPDTAPEPRPRGAVAPTTTGMTHGELTEPVAQAPSTRGRLVGVGFAALALAAAAIFMLRPGAAPTPAAKPAATPKPAPVELSRLVVSQPPGAEVFEGDKALGAAPLNLRFVEGETLKLELRAEGHAPAQLSLNSASPAKVTATLSPLAVADAGKPDAAPVVDAAPKPGTPKKARARPRKKRRPKKKDRGRDLLGLPN